MHVDVYMSRSLFVKGLTFNNPPVVCNIVLQGQNPLADKRKVVVVLVNFF